MYQPFTAELARQRRCELRQEAALFRQTKETRAAKDTDRKSVLHRLVGGA